MYSSAASASPTCRRPHIAGDPLAEPRAIWIALWDNVLNVTGSPYEPAVWPVAPVQAVRGPVVSARVSLDIDADWWTARLRGVTGTSPIRTGRIQFAITGQCS